MDSSTNTIYFYETRGPYGSFSNFSRDHVWMKSLKWPTSEHYFQAMKFEGTPFEEMVRNAPNPSDAAKLGRDRSKPLRKDWEQVKDEIMRQVCFAKFTQHKHLKEVLLNTGDATLVEHTTKDSYWGDGGDGTGKNMLGKTLMIVRQQVRDLENQKSSNPESKKEEVKQVTNSMAATEDEVEDSDEEEDEDVDSEEDDAPNERYVNGLRIISAPSANANPKRALDKKKKNRRKRNVFVDESGTSKMEKSNEFHGNIKLVGGDASVTFSEKALPPSAKMVVHRHQFQRRWEPNERDLKRSEDDDEEEEQVSSERRQVSLADYLQTSTASKSEGMTADESLQAADSALELIKAMPDDEELKERCKLICGVMREWIERTENETMLAQLIGKLEELSVYEQ